MSEGQASGVESAKEAGSICVMKATIDAAGRVLIPSKLRREAGLVPGMSIDIRLQNGRIEIEPAPLPVRLERRGRWLVAVPEQDVPELTTETVEQTRQAIEHERSTT